jgi:hypothetical protein
VEHGVSEQHEHNDDQETDKFSIQFPIGGGMNVSGPNASKLWGKIGWAVVIATSAVAAAHFLRAVADLVK